MALLTDVEIKEILEKNEIAIDPFSEECLKGASYDMRLGKRAIVTRSISLEELRGKVAGEGTKELDIEKERSIGIPPGGFALVATLERIRLSDNYAGHIGLRTYHLRKGLAVLSGLQIDPGWDGILVLGLCNLSPREVILDYSEPICAIEIHKLAQRVGKPYLGPYMEEQREGRIPKADKDYLRTIETMSISDLTKALLSLSNSVKTLSRNFWLFWIPLIIVFFGIVLQLFLK